MTRKKTPPSEDPDRPWFPPAPLGHRIEWFLLLFSTLTILTNAYFLQFAEDAISRKLLAYVAVAATGLWMWIGDVPPDVEFGVAAAPWPA